MSGGVVSVASRLTPVVHFLDQPAIRIALKLPLLPERIAHADKLFLRIVVIARHAAIWIGAGVHAQRKVGISLRRAGPTNR